MFELASAGQISTSILLVAGDQIYMLFSQFIVVSHFRPGYVYRAMHGASYGLLYTIGAQPQAASLKLVSQ